MKSDTVALMEKQAREKLSAFRRGRFDFAGFLLKLVLTCSLAVIFALFFWKFSGVYLTVKTSGRENPTERLYELLTILYFLLLLSSAVGSANSLSRELFEREDLTLLSAMPIKRGAVFLSGILTVCLNQILFFSATVLPLSIVAAARLLQGAGFYLRTLLSVLVMPLFSVFAGAIFSLPFHAIRRFLREKYLLTLIAATLLSAVGFFVYAKLLGGVKELLLGDDLKYFFSERITSGIASVVKWLYPGNLIARFALGESPLKSLLIFLLISAGLIVLSLIPARSMTLRAERIRARNAAKKSAPSKKLPLLFSLMKKELLEILRTPGYAFSCFSVAALLPLMVYFCMSVGSSLVVRLIGFDCNAELALLLTLLFGALSNVFCSTNVSREGENFYVLKAMPMGAGAVFSAKLLLQTFVSAAAQAISALVLSLTGYISASVSALIFASGTVYSLAQICLATRYDLACAKFSTEEDGKVSESGGAVSVAILFGMLSAFAIGGGALAVKLFAALRLGKMMKLLPLVAGFCASAILSLAALGLFYFRLNRRYYRFSGGGLI